MSSWSGSSLNSAIRRNGASHRRRWATAVSLAATVLTVSGWNACSTAAPIPPRDEDFEAVLEIDDLRRTYQVHVPSGYTRDVEYPLLLALHGAGFGGAGMRGTTGLDSVADRYGFIVAYPDGINGGWVWDPSFSETVDDLKFLTELLERLGAQVSVDPDRIYATGFSAGGMMTQKLACGSPGRVAGIAVVGATLPRRVGAECLSSASRARPLSVLSILGTNDPLIPFDGDTASTDLSLLSAAATMELWAARNGCGSLPDTAVAYRDETYGITTQRIRYTGCSGSLETELYAMDGAGHIWPVTIMPASEVIAEFLLRQRR